jgi:hypothetical protein
MRSDLAVKLNFLSRQKLHLLTGEIVGFPQSSQKTSTKLNLSKQLSQTGLGESTPQRRQEEGKIKS